MSSGRQGIGMVILESMGERNNWADLETTAQRFLEEYKITDPDFARAVGDMAARHLESSGLSHQLKDARLPSRES